MSTPRHGWWSYVKYMIRQYPELQREYAALHQQRITQQYDAASDYTSFRRSTELCAVRELPATKQREYEAVKRALSLTENGSNTGKLRIDLIDLVFWKQSHTLEGAALQLHCSYRTARRYQSDIIYLVAKLYGLMDE